MIPDLHGPSDLSRVAFDLLPAGMIAVDTRGRIVLVNQEAERLFGYTREELLGQPVETLVPESHRARHLDLLGAFMGAPGTRRMGEGRELLGRRKDGSEFPVEIGLNPIRSGEDGCVLASIVDISARRRLEELARQSQKMEAIGTLAGGIAHDFNNVLLSIIGHVELAMGEHGDPGQQQRDLGQVLQAAERGRELVQRILTFSRKREVSRVPTRLDGVIDDAVKFVRASLPSTVEMRISLDPGTPAVASDRTEIHQILLNLASNASHAMPDGGMLEITLEPFEVDATFAKQNGLAPGPHARLTVSDDGRGMTPEVLRRSLEPFYTTKPPGQGTGLGLSVVQGIVREHGGALVIESTPGRGTTVTIHLPASKPSAPAPAAPSAPTAGRGAWRVLLVEDEPGLAAMERRQLEHLGYRVTVHTSGEEALAAFRRDPGSFDLLLTDNSMPRMSGLVLTQEVLRLRPDLPVIMASGIAESMEPEEMRAHGVRRMLRKPHTSLELDAAIREVLGDR